MYDVCINQNSYLHNGNNRTIEHMKHDGTCSINLYLNASILPIDISRLRYSHMSGGFPPLERLPAIESGDDTISSFIPSTIVQDHNPQDDEAYCARNKPSLLVFFNSWLYIYIYHVVISDEFAISSILIMYGVSKTQLVGNECSTLSFPTQQLHRRRGRRP